MGERPDEVGRRDPLGRPDPLAGGEPGFDPATDAFEPDAVNRDVGEPALHDEVEVDRVEVTKIEIERTRADMSETVDAIQERLSPQNLKEQAKDRVKEATVGRAEQAMNDAGDKAKEAGSGVVGTIRSNPLPAALTGIGLGWLFVSARKQGSSQPTYRDTTYVYPPTNEYAPPVSEYPSRYEDEETGGPSAASQALGRARDGVGETATQAQEKAGQVASQTRDKAGNLAGTVQDRASRLGTQTRSTARRIGTGSQRMLQENPLAVGALAVGVGAAVGLAVPETSEENEVMGEARDNLVDKAQEKAQDVQQRVQQVAEEAQGAAQQEAENQGLTQQ
jgi:ElaB/YqjD/DUF883 family membrane-anchored ribosome-binding protein